MPSLETLFLFYDAYIHTKLGKCLATATGKILTPGQKYPANPLVFNPINQVLGNTVLSAN